MRDRTADLLRARQALSQLSYSPIQLLQRPLLPLNRVNILALRMQFLFRQGVRKGRLLR